MVLTGGLHCTLCSIDIHSNTCKCIRPETKACAKSFRNHTPISLRSANSQNLDNNGMYSHPTSGVLFKQPFHLFSGPKFFLQKELCKSWVRLLQPLLPSSHEKMVGWGPFSISVQLCPINWILLVELKGTYFPNSPSSQNILEICIRGGGLSIHSPTMDLGLSLAPHTFTKVHGYSSFPFEADGNPPGLC